MVPIEVKLVLLINDSCSFWTLASEFRQLNKIITDYCLKITSVSFLRYLVKHFKFTNNKQ